MKTDNELIAEFIGLQVYEKWSDVQAVPIDDLKPYLMLDQCDRFQKSWDALMPVVEKIAEYRMAYPKEAGWVCDCKIVVLRHLLYREVVNFIKWHNNSLT